MLILVFDFCETKVIHQIEFASFFIDCVTEENKITCKSYKIKKLHIILRHLFSLN